MPQRKRGDQAGTFLEPHQREAARRLEALFERACLRQRVTMHYSPIGAGKTRQGGSGDISDIAAEARKTLARIEAHLPRDCAGVLVDVYCYDKGLQLIETERGWPRRSAKLVLRIGLDHLANWFGLRSTATGAPARGSTGWMGQGARPSEFW